MNNKKSNFLPPFGLSSEESSTSSSSSLISSDKNNIQSTEQLLHLKETKTHLFCLIPSENENAGNPKKNPQLIRIKISKRRPQSRYLKANKVFDCSRVKSGVSNLELLASSNQQKIRKFLNLETSSSGPVSNSKKTGYPSFIVLPKNKKHGEGTTKKTFARNQSTSDNSNETYVIRSKEENKLLPRRATVGSQTSFGSNVFCPTISNDNEIKASGTSLYGFKGSGSTESKVEDYCECAKGVARRPIDSLNRTSDLGKIKDNFIVEPKEPASFHLKSLNSVKLFRIKFNKPTQANVSLRLKAGQDREDKNCKGPPCTCPKINRIFPPEGSSARPDELHSNYSESMSSVYANSSNDDILKINYYSVRQCLKCSSANEKCEVLDALRMRIKSKTLNMAIDTVQDIVKFDLFGVQCECRSRPILEDLLWPISDRIPNPLQTSIARLINAMVSYEIGRDYFDNRSIIRLLTWGNSGRDNIDEEMADNLMAIMMKLSTNRFQCADMIKKGLLKWLVNHMEEVEFSASPYHLKCMTGLLRMLLSVENLIDLSLIEMRRWLVLLGRYLDNNNIDLVRTNILASLLTLLQIQGAVKSANEINFTKIIQKHIETSSHLKENDYLQKINQLLTGQSNVIKSLSSAIRLTKEDMYSDDEMKSVSDAKEDYYYGEKLLREKFGNRKEKDGSVESHTTKVNFQETKNRPYKRQKDDHLISRVFVEHLHCLLPNIDRNRIFPMFNYRSSDKPPQTCLRIDDPPTPRPPYVLASMARAKDLRDRLSKQEKQVSPEQLLKEEIASTPKIDHQLSAEKLHELSATIANDQELTAGKSKALKDEILAEQKSNQQVSAGASEMNKEELTSTPQNDEELFAGEHETLKDEQKSDHFLSAIATETSQDELNAAKPETLSHEILAEQKSDKRLPAEATETSKDELIFIPKNDRELSAGESETMKERVLAEQKSDRQLTAGVTEALKDELIARPTNDQLAAGESEALKDEVLAEQKSNQQVSAGASEMNKEELTSTPQNDEELFAGEHETLKDEQKSDHFLSAIATETSQDELNAAKPETLSHEILAEQKSDKRLPAEATETSKDELIFIPKNDRELSAGESETMKERVLAEQKSDRQLTAGVTEALKDELIARPTNDQLAAGESEALKDEVLAEQKSNQQVSAGASETNKEEITSTPQDDEELSAGEHETLKDEQKSDHFLSAIAAEMSQDELNAAKPETLSHEVLTEQKSDKQLPAGATETSKDELIFIPKNDRELSAEESETMKERVLAEQKSDRQLTAGVTEALKDELIATPTNDQLAAGESEALKEQIANQRSDQEILEGEMETLKEIPRRANDQELSAGEPETHKDEFVSEEKSDQQLTAGVTESLKDELIARPTKDQLAVEEFEALKEEIAKQRSDQEILEGEMESSKEIPRRANDQELPAGEPETHKDAFLSEQKSDQQLTARVTESLKEELIVRPTNDQLAAGEPEALKEQIAKQKSDQQLLLGETETSKEIPKPAIGQELSTGEPKILKDKVLAEQKSDQKQTAVAAEALDDELTAIPGNDQLVAEESETLKQQLAEQKSDHETLVGEAGESETLIDAAKHKREQQAKVVYARNEQNSLPRSVDLARDQGISRSVSDRHLMMDATRKSQEQKFSAVRSHQQLSPRSVEKVRDDERESDLLPAAIRNSNETITTVKSDQQVRIGSLKTLKGESFLRSRSNEQPGVSNKPKEQLVMIPKSDRQLSAIPVDTLNDETIHKASSDISLPDAAKTDQHLSAEATETFKNELTARSTKDDKLAAGDLATVENEQKCDHQLPEAAEEMPNDGLIAKRVRDQESSTAEAKTLKGDVAAEQKSYQQLLAGVIDTSKEVVTPIPANDQKLFAVEPETLTGEVSAEQKSDQLSTAEATETLKDKVIAAPANDEALLVSGPETVIDKVLAAQKSDPQISVGATETSKDVLSDRPVNDQELSAGKPETLKDEVAVKQKFDPQFSAREMDEFTVRPENDQELSAGEPETLKDDAGKQNSTDDELTAIPANDQLVAEESETLKQQLAEQKSDHETLVVEAGESETLIDAAKHKREQQQKVVYARNEQHLLPRSVELARDQGISRSVLKDETIPRSKSNEQPGISNKSKEQLVPSPIRDRKLSTVPVDTLNHETIDKASSDISLPDAAKTDQHLSAEATETSKNELTARSTEDEKLAAGDLETVKNEPKIDQQLTEGTSNNELTAKCAKDQESSAEKAETLKDDIAAEQKSDQKLSHGATDVLKDELTARPAHDQLAVRDPETLKEQFAKEKGDQEILEGETETFNKIPRPANDQELSAGEPETHKDEVLSEQKNDQQLKPGVTEALQDELIARPTDDELAAGEPETLKEQTAKQKSDQQILLGETETSKEIPRPATCQELSTGGPKILRNEVRADHESDEKQSPGATVALNDALTVTPANDQLDARDPETLKEQFSKQKSDQQILLGETEMPKEIPRTAASQKLSTGEPKILKDEVLAEQKSDQKKSAGAREALNDELTATPANFQLPVRDPETMKDQFAKQKSNQEILVGETEESETLIDAAKQKSDQKENVVYAGNEQNLLRRSVELVRDQGICRSVSDRHLMMDTTRKSQEEKFSAVRRYHQLSPRSVEIIRDDKRASYLSPADAIRNSKETITSVRSDQQRRVGSLETLKDESFLRSKSNERPGVSNKSKEQLLMIPKSDRQLSAIPVDTLNDETIHKASSDISFPDAAKTDQYLSAEATETSKNELTSRSTKDGKLAVGDLETVKNEQKSDRQLSEGAEGTSNDELTAKLAKDQELSAGEADDVTGKQKCDQQLLAEVIDTSKDVVTTIPANDQNLCAVEPETVTDEVPAEQKSDQLLTAEATETLNKLITAPANDEELLASEPETVIDEVLAEQKSDPQITVGVTETSKDELTDRPVNDQELSAGEPETLKDDAGKQNDIQQLSSTSESSSNPELVETLKDETVSSLRSDQEVRAIKKSKEEKDLRTAVKSNRLLAQSVEDARIPKRLSDQEVCLKSRSNDERIPFTKVEQKLSTKSMEVLEGETITKLENSQHLSIDRKQKADGSLSCDPLLPVRSLVAPEFKRRVSDQELGLKSKSNDKTDPFTKNEQKLSTKSMEVLEGETIATLESSQHLSIDAANQKADGGLKCDPLLPVRSIVAHEIKRLVSDQDSAVDTKGSNQDAASVLESADQLSARSIETAVYKRACEHQLASSTIRQSKEKTFVNQKSNEQLPEESVEASNDEAITREDSNLVPVDKNRKSNMESVNQVYDKDVVKRTPRPAADVAQLTPRSVEILKDEIIDRRATNQHLAVDTTIKSKQRPVVALKDQHLFPRSMEILKDDTIVKQPSDHPIPAAVKGKITGTGSAVLNSLDEAVCTLTHTLADNRGNVATHHISSSAGSVMIYRGDEGIVRNASEKEQVNTVDKRKENQVDPTKNIHKLTSRSVDLLKDDEIDRRSGHPSPAGIVKKSSWRNDHQQLPGSSERLKEEEIAVSSITKSTDRVVASPRRSQQLLARSIILHDRAFESAGSDQKRTIIFTEKSNVGASNIVMVRSVEKMTNESTSRRPPIDQTVNESPHSAIHSAKVSKKKSKIKTADSNIIWREMLNNDQLINKLCDKVLKKMVAENKFCGPNCKSSCGGLNPYYESNKDKADKDK